MTWTRCISPAGQNVMERQEGLARDGCLLNIIVAPDDKIIARAGKAIRPNNSTALVDTGASKVCIDYRIAQELGLRETGQRTLTTVGGNVEARVYIGVLEVPELDFRDLMEFVAPRVPFNVRALLGRSFLREFIVNFDGPSGEVHFSRKSRDIWLPADEG